MTTFAGAEIWMLDAAAGLRDRGWEVTFVGTPGAPLLERAADDDFACEAVPIRFDAAPWTLLKLYAVLKRRRIRAVLCNRLKDLKAAGVAARLAGVPVVLQSRESDFPLRARPYYRWYYNSVATGVLVNSQATLETTRRSAPWLDPRRLHLLYKGIDRRRYFATPLPEGRPVIGFAGRLDERKGVPLLMEAWTKLSAWEWTVPPILRVAGDGPLRETLRIWQSALPRPGDVELLGWVDDMPSFLRSLNLLVVPSRYEGFGLAAAEAMACGRPVIAARASSLPELVVDGTTGRLFPPGDAAALVAAVTELLGDPDARERMGEAGHDRVAERFDRERMLDALENLLHPPRRMLRFGPRPRPRTREDA
jgi:glycosyltransferase involved in cell wall biosynthesis